MINHIEQAIRAQRKQGQASQHDPLDTPLASRDTDPSVATTSSQFSKTDKMPRASEWKGSLAQLDIARLFAILLRRRASGQLLLTRRNEVRKIWFSRRKYRRSRVQSTGNKTSLYPVARESSGAFSSGAVRRNYRKSPAWRAALRSEGWFHGLKSNRSIACISAWLCARDSLGRKGIFCFSQEPRICLDSRSSSELSNLLLQAIREGYPNERLLRILGVDESNSPMAFAKRA